MLDPVFILFLMYCVVNIINTCYTNLKKILLGLNDDKYFALSLNIYLGKFDKIIFFFSCIVSLFINIDLI